MLRRIIYVALQPEICHICADSEELPVPCGIAQPQFNLKYANASCMPFSFKNYLVFLSKELRRF